MSSSIVADTLVPELAQQWGSLEGDPELSFGAIRSFTPSDGGGVFIYESDRGIREFSASGEFLRTLAREGQGPGEVEAAFAMESAAGRLVAWDAGNKRIYIWNEDLELAHTAPTPRYWVSYDESAVNVLDSGEVWVKLAPDGSSDGRGFPRAEYLRIWPGPADTLFVPAGGEACSREYDTRYRNGFWADLRDPWFPSTVSALGSRGEVYVGCNDDFQFTREGSEGSITFMRPNRDQRVPDDERRFFESAWTPPMGTLPEFRPEYSRIVPGRDGRVWVFETSPAQEAEISDELAAMGGYARVLTVAEREGHFSVVNELGKLMAVVKLPADIRYSGFPTTRSVVIRGDTIWALRTGQLDEQYIGKYVVPFGPR